MPSQTQWRWGESGETRLGEQIPDWLGKFRGTLSKFDTAGGTRVKLSERFRGSSDRSPVTRNREFVSSSRKILAGGTGL
jgi:hypothetical protein